MRLAKWAGSAAALSICNPALADDKWIVQPIQVGSESVRYNQGVPTVALEMQDGVVQVTPLPMDHGSLSFGVAVYNDSRRPANFGVENLSAANAGTGVGIFSKAQLAKQAKNRATWTSIGLALLGATASAAASSQRNYYRSTFVTPRGTYRSYWSAPSTAGQIQASGIAATTGYAVALVQRQLDHTLATLGDEIVQTTTVDPGESYAGRVVIAKVRPKQLPSKIELTVNWNGEVYPFTFQVAKPGSPTPIFTDLASRSDLIDFRPRAELAATSARAPTPVKNERTAQRAPVSRQADAGSSPLRSDGFVVGSRVKCITCR